MKSIVKGEKIALQDVNDARETRIRRQQYFLAQYKLPLISFSLSIVGEIKVFPLSVKSFHAGVQLIKNHCKTYGLTIVDMEEAPAKTGYEAIFVLNTTAEIAKSVTSQLEKSLPLGRLFDIDVIDTNGKALSRTELGHDPRPCLVCQEETFGCATEKRHSVEEILAAEIQIMQNHFLKEYAKKVSHLAGDALLYQANVTPKPGLVDRNNTGAHANMSLHTLQLSVFALLPYFEKFVLLGAENEKTPPATTLKKARKLGQEAETAMYAATNGVNTHKGTIFSFGIACTCMGILHKRNADFHGDDFIPLCKDLCNTLSNDFVNITQENAKTSGEKLYASYKVGGARQEATNAFPTIFKMALPLFENCVTMGMQPNEAGVLTLLHIMANAQDTNMIARSDFNSAEKMQKKIRNFIQSKEEDFMGFATELDKDFIHFNISAGGSADLLALTYFFYTMEKEG